jgi:phosphotriesterase-related protein
VNFVRTLLGDIRAVDLGRCYAHEHVLIQRSYTTQIFPEIHLPSVEKAIRELADFKKAGGGAMVDCMPCDAGRSVEKLAEISRRAGVHIVGSTGLHRMRFYPEGHWRYRVGVERLTELFVTEIEEGIDANDCGGPDVRRTGHGAGVIKLGSDGPELDEPERAAFEAGASAHKRTGCPIITHCEAGRGPEQAAFLRSLGVDLARVVLSHVDRHPDPAYHRDLLRTGVFVEYDRTFRAPLDDANPTLRLFVEMSAEFPSQVMLGTDGARPTYWRSYGGSPGLDYLLLEFSDRARRLGASAEVLNRAFVDNPARAFAFAP